MQSKLEAVKKEMSAQFDMQAFKLEKAYKEIEKLKKRSKRSRSAGRRKSKSLNWKRMHSPMRSRKSLTR